MNNSQHIQWKRIAIEAIVIVVSILLAFAIDAWWENRQSAVEEQAILASLYQEAQELVRVVDRNRIYTDALREATRRAYNASAAADEDLGDDEIDQFLIDVGWHIEPSTANAPVLESLVKGGDLDLISNGELRRHLGTTMVLIDGFGQEILRDSTFYNGIFLPYLQRNASLGQVYNVESHWPGLPEIIYPSYNIDPANSEASNREVFFSREFQNLLLHRLTTTTNILEWQEIDLEPQLDAVVELIERELKVRN